MEGTKNRDLRILDTQEMMNKNDFKSDQHKSNTENGYLPMYYRFKNDDFYIINNIHMNTYSLCFSDV